MDVIMNMNDKLSIEQANPLSGIKHVTNHSSDIKPFCTKVEFKSETGLIVTLPNDDTCLLSTPELEDNMEIKPGDEIDILFHPEGLAMKDNGTFRLYMNVLSKARDGQIFKASVIAATRQGLLISIEGIQCFMPEGQIGLEKRDDLQTFVGDTIDVKLISVKLKEKEGNRFLPIVSHKILEDEKNVIEAQDKLRRSEEHTSELQSPDHLVCRLLLEKK